VFLDKPGEDGHGGADEEDVEEDCQDWIDHGSSTSVRMVPPA